MPHNKVNVKFLTKEDYVREFALRAGRGNSHTNYHSSEEAGKKLGQLEEIHDKKRKPDNIASKDNSVLIYILCILLTKLKP